MLSERWQSILMSYELWTINETKFAKIQMKTRNKCGKCHRDLFLKRWQLNKKCHKTIDVKNMFYAKCRT